LSHAGHMPVRLYSKEFIFLLLLSSFQFSPITCLEEDVPLLYSPLRQTRANNCDIYLAPSPPRGWGVFAARDFEEHEIIEIAPRFLPIRIDILQQTVLNDYHYAFRWELTPDDLTTWGVIAFGMIMFYNHGEGDLHNVQFLQFGREPDAQSPALSMGLGYAAMRKIKRGEELLGTYGGEHWFTGRGLTMETPTEAAKIQSVEEMDRLEKQFCSKAVAGIGHSTWYRLLLSQEALQYSSSPQMEPHQFLPLQDHPSAAAKLPLRPGQVIEYAPALVLPDDHIRNSFLEPLCFLWDDWDETQQQNILKLREEGSFRMRGINDRGELEWDVLDHCSNAVIFPVGGSIGLVRKVGKNDPSKSNCRIEIVPATAADKEKENFGSAGLVLKLIAKKSIQEGEELRLDVPDSSSWFSKISLLQELAMTGQPVPTFLANPYNDAAEKLFDVGEAGVRQKDEL